MELSDNIILIIIVTSVATFISRFLGVLTAEKINEKSIIFSWFNYVAYSILAAMKLHRDFIRKFRYARVKGPSAKFDWQRVGLDHLLEDGDLLTIVVKR